MEAHRPVVVPEGVARSARASWAGPLPEYPHSNPDGEWFQRSRRGSNLRDGFPGSSMVTAVSDVSGLFHPGSV
jgi:hypothetical protein